MEENLNTQTLEPTKNSKKKLIIIICIIVGIALIGLAVFLIIHLNSNKHKIVGTWKQESATESNADKSKVSQYYSYKSTKDYWEFTSNDNILYNLKSDSGDDAEIKYEIDGDKLSVIEVIKDLGEDRSVRAEYRITKLTKDELELQDIESPTKILKFTKAALSKSEREKELAIREENDKLAEANFNAYMLYCSISIASYDNDIYEHKTSKVTSIKSLKDESGAIEKEIYEGFEYNKELGYYYAEYDSNDETDYIDERYVPKHSFVQWSADESGTIIGQYPNPPSTPEEARHISFGTKH